MNKIHEITDMFSGNHIIDLPSECTVKLKFNKNIYDMEKTKFTYRIFHISAIDDTHFYIGEHKMINIMHTTELATLFKSALSIKIVN